MVNDSQLSSIKGQEFSFEIFDFAPIATIIFEDKKILYLNPTAVSLYGYEHKSELIEKDSEILIPEALREKIKKRDKRREEGLSQLSSFETLGKKKDGTIFPHHIRIDLFHFNNRVLLLAFVVDLSKEIESKRALVISENKFHKIIDMCPTPVALIDDASLFYANQLFLQMFDLKNDDLKSIYIDSIFPKFTTNQIGNLLIQQDDYETKIFHDKLSLADLETQNCKITLNRLYIESKYLVILFIQNP